jgi:hypothetical protein
MASFQSLFAIFDELAGPPPSDLPNAIRVLPDEAKLPDLGVISSVIKAACDVPRQHRAYEDLVRPLLMVDEVRHVLQDVPVMEGRVPQQPDWRFSVGPVGHLVWATLSHRCTGETISVPLPAAAVLDEKSQALAVAALSDCSLRMANCEWYDWGGARMHDERANRSWLARSLPAHEKSIRAFHRRWQEVEQRPWLSAKLGDWPTAHAAALISADERLRTVTEPRARKWFSKRSISNWEFTTVTPWDTRWALQTIAAHHADFLDELLREGLPGGKLDQYSRDVVLDLDLPGWEKEIRAWFMGSRAYDSFDPDVSAAAYLARRGLGSRQVFDRLRENSHPLPGGWDLCLALLQARYEPQLGQDLFRQGLRAADEESRVEALAALALAEWPWATAVLKSALRTRCPITLACRRLAQRFRSEHDSLPPTAKARAVANDRHLFKVTRVPPIAPLRYFGTTAEYFEDVLDKVRWWFKRLG